MEHLTEKQITELRTAFRSLENVDGLITTNELKIMMQKVERTCKCDTQDIDDSDRVLNFKECLVIIARKLQHIKYEEEIINVFKVFDGNENGYINFTDLRYLMRTLGIVLSDEELYDMMEVANEDHEGKISFQAFRKMYLNSIF